LISLKTDGKPSLSDFVHGMGSKGTPTDSLTESK
jgi:hypothetical protein